MITTITQKGQITIPIQIRRQLKLKKGTPCTFTIRNGELILMPFKKDMNLNELRDLLKEGLPTSQEFIASKKN